MDYHFSCMSNTDKPSRENKGKSLILFPSEYVVLDLETTGLDPMWNEIIEIGAIRVKNGEIVSQFSQLVKPNEPIDEFITELTGITNDMVADAPPIKNVLPFVLEFIGSSLIVGHNVNFDINFLYDNCEEFLGKGITNDYVDTMRLSRRLFPEEAHHRLIDLEKRFELHNEKAHRALSDVLLTNQCLDYMKKYVSEHNLNLEELLKRERKTPSAKSIVATRDDFDESSPVFQKVFVFTGTLDRMPRKDAMQAVVDNGGFCGDGVTKKTNYLVLGNNDYCSTIKGGKSSKQKKAEQLRLAGHDIEIISENVFYDMISNE